MCTLSSFIDKGMSSMPTCSHFIRHVAGVVHGDIGAGVGDGGGRRQAATRRRRMLGCQGRSHRRPGRRLLPHAWWPWRCRDLSFHGHRAGGRGRCGAACSGGPATGPGRRAPAGSPRRATGEGVAGLS
uniref:Uncharacterized protein n=1 Tax=Arundo donax TaxID=35708 RepID=A0A0A9GAP8_ARUDO